VSNGTPTHELIKAQKELDSQRVDPTVRQKGKVEVIADERAAHADRLTNATVWSVIE
jgi:hypothetical protein